MIYTVTLNCQQLVWGFKKVSKKLFAFRNVMSFTLHEQLHLTNHLCLIVSFDNLHKSIYILSNIFLIDN